MSSPAVRPGSECHSLPAETVERLRRVFVKFAVLLVAALLLPTIGLSLAIAAYRETATGLLERAATLTPVARLFAGTAILSGVFATVTAARDWAAWTWTGMLFGAIFWPALTRYAGHKLRQTVTIARNKVTTEVRRG